MVLSRHDGSLVRYSYGDWRYYAQGETGLWHGLRALFLRSQGTLGRRELAGPVDTAQILIQMQVGSVAILQLQAEAMAVDTLIQILDGIYRDNLASRIYRAEYDLEFVHHPRAYSLGYNSNRAVAEWLQSLGAEVHGQALLSRWRMAD